VLEISIDGGVTFQDILTVGTFVTGVTMARSAAVVAILWLGGRHGLPPRPALVPTTVNLPVTNMVLRRRMSSDNSVSGEAWRVDTIVVTPISQARPAHSDSESNTASSSDAASTPVVAVITGIAIGDEVFPRSTTRGYSSCPTGNAVGLVR
jgi:hypothetical protein